MPSVQAELDVKYKVSLAQSLEDHRQRILLQIAFNFSPAALIPFLCVHHLVICLQIPLGL